MDIVSYEIVSALNGDFVFDSIERPNFRHLSELKAYQAYRDIGNCHKGDLNQINYF